MKIAIQGNIIDTDNIYKVSNLQLPDKNSYGHHTIKFTVESFNQKKLYFAIETGSYNSHSSYLVINQNTSDEILSHDGKLTPEDLVTSSSYKKALAEISKMRDDIIKVWTEQGVNRGTSFTTRGIHQINNDLVMVSDERIYDE